MKRLPSQKILAIFLLALLITPAEAKDQTYETTNKKVHLLELFTSEGCSFCPAGEERFSSFLTPQRLWKEIVPVSYHVDYWDHLGWLDALSQQKFTTRQRNYARGSKTGNVYTPSFFLNGAEWTTWHLKPVPSNPLFYGTLKAVFHSSSGVLDLKFWPSTGTKAQNWKFVASLTSLSGSVAIQAGENKGKRLRHRFSALNLLETPGIAQKDGSYLGSLNLFQDAKKGSAESGLGFSAWVLPEGSHIPVQALGGELP